MKADRARGLNVGDVMILTAASALALALIPANLWITLESGFRSPRAFARIVWALDTAIVPAWMIGTYAILLIRLRRPRPRSGRLARQPGFAAGAVAATVGTGLLGFELACEVARPREWMIREIEFSRLVIDLAGPAVLGAWLTLRLLGAWRPEPGPIDRLGRILGVGWIAMTLLRLGTYFNA